MRPDTIEKALEFVHEEMNTLYLQQRNDRAPDRKPQSQHQVSLKFSYGYKPPVQMTPTMPRSFNLPPPKPIAMPEPSRPFMSQAQQSVPIWKNQSPQYLGPSRTQQMFSSPPPNYRPQTQNFKMPGPRPTASNVPQPMSGVSHYVPKPFTPRAPHDWSKSGNLPLSNYFKSRELNYNNFDDRSHNYYGDCYIDNDYYPQEYFEYPDYVREYAYEQPQCTDSFTIEEVENAPSAENEDIQKAPKSNRD